MHTNEKASWVVRKVMDDMVSAFTFVWSDRLMELFEQINDDINIRQLIFSCNIRHFMIIVHIYPSYKTY